MQEVLVDGGQFIAKDMIQKFDYFRVTFHASRVAKDRPRVHPLICYRRFRGDIENESKYCKTGEKVER